MLQEQESDFSMEIRDMAAQRRDCFRNSFQISVMGFAISRNMLFWHPGIMAYIVSDLLREMIRRLADNGVYEPEVSAKRILTHITGMERAEMYADDRTLIYEPEINAAKAAIERRISGEPVAYIVGGCEFYNIKLKIDRRVLVPRPETEVLLDEVISRLREQKGKLIAADIGTGSGNIAISIAFNIPGLRIIATDIDAFVLELAMENAEMNGVADRIEFREGDLFAPLGNEYSKFDAIISNPPYVSEQERNILPVEVRKYEPARALFAGADGLSVIKKIVSQAPRYLKAGGLLALEIGYQQGSAVRDLMTRDFREVELLKDLAGTDRVIVGYKGQP